MAGDSSAAVRIDTTPTLPNPPVQFVEAAMRGVPTILANVPPRHDGAIQMIASHLAKRLQDGGHTLAAAQWAVHESVRAGRLQPGLIETGMPCVGLPLPGDGIAWSGGQRWTIPIPKGKPAPFDSFKVAATESLWAWWRSAPDEAPKQAQAAEPAIKAGEAFSKRSDLERLVAALEDEIDDRETSIPEEFVPPEPLRGRELYHAVQAVERHYGGKLPMGPWQAWRGMLRRADERKGEADPNERYERYYAYCESLAQWAKVELSRITGAHSGCAGLIEQLLAGPDDAELSPRELALLEAYLKQPVSLAQLPREAKAEGKSESAQRRNKLKLIRDFNRNLRANSPAAVRSGQAESGAQPRDSDPTPRESDAVHSIDFRSVRWWGEKYTFTATQAACVQVLWRNWEQGTPVISEVTVLDDAGSAGDRLRDAFDKGKHPAWGTLIKPAGKGAFQLAEPDES